jgi:hypothetical protein
MNQPLVYVIIINWNGREHLEACFASLLTASYPNVVFLLVDNASSDDSLELVERRFGRDPRVEVLPLAENCGWSGGNNAGIHQALKAGANYLFLLNNDTATGDSAIESMVAAMEADGSVGALAPRMVLFDQPDILNSVGLTMSLTGTAWDRGIGRLDGPSWHRSEPVIGVCGGACFLRATVLEQTGLLPEDFEIYLDDLDLCLRIWTAGYRICTCPDAVVRHKFSATMGAGARARHKYYLNTRNRFRILVRHFPWASAPRVIPRLLLGEIRAIGNSLRTRETWRIPSHLRAWAAALAYLSVAWRFRRTVVKKNRVAFWSLVVASPMFCPRIVFPEQGWYPPIVVRGERLRPMAGRATCTLDAGPLQVRLVNCYPALGPAHITLFAGDTCLGDLVAETEAVAHFELTEGITSVIARSIFPMENTGAFHDTGAWLQLTRNGAPLV